MSNINFVNAYWLLLAIPLVALFAVPFFLAVRKDNVNGHNVASGVLHVVMALLIAFSAAGTNVVTTITETDVYVLADVSYSANRNLTLIDGYIDNLARSLPGNSHLGVVCFGKNQRILTRLNERRRSVADALRPEGLTAAVDDSETDIVSALEYTGSLFRDGVIKRIVVITDGAQSYAEDANVLKRAVDRLAAEKIKVDAIFVDDNLEPSVKEIQLSSVQHADNVFLNYRQTANIIIQSSYQTSAKVSLFKNGEEETVRVFDLSMGSNSIPLTLDTSEEGTYEYEARVEAVENGGDANLHNNAVTFSQTVTSELNVMLVAGSASDYATVHALFPDAAIDEYYLPCAVPVTVEELCRYDEIILCNADVRLIENGELFSESLNTVVSMFGKSLLTIGDTALQNDSENKYSTIRNMLPVRFGANSELPKLFTIVIDASSSMLGERITLAKMAAKHLVDNLADEDEVAVIFFNGNSGFLYPATKVGDAAKRAEIKSRIDGKWIEHGTDISLGFEEVRSELIDLDFSEKQVMLISDGLDLNITNANYESPLKLVDMLRANGIHTSVIDVGRGGDQGNAATKAQRLLEDIASPTHGGGTYYFANTEELLQGVVFDDIDNEMGETIIEQYSFVEVNSPRDSVLDGVSFSADDYVTGFINNKAIPLATTVLTTSYQKIGSEIDVPVYAYRTLGNGRVASFTCDLSKWIRPWSKELRDKFLANMFATNIPTTKVDYPFTVNASADNGYATVEVIPAVVRAAAEAEITVTLPDGQTLSSQLALASTLYSYSFALPQLGKYDIAITYRYGVNEYTVHANVHNSYLAEYNSFTVYDAGVLNRMVGANGTVSEDGTLVIKNDEDEVGTYTLSLTVPLLVTAVALYAVDIIVRKLKWEDIVSLFRKVKK